MDEERQIDPTAVTDIETARLALRWALERIHLLQDEGSKAKDTAQSALDKIRILTDQLAHKDETLHRWQSTIKAWETNVTDHQAM